METDNTGYIPNISARIQAAIHTNANLLSGGAVTETKEFYPGKMSGCLFHFTAQMLSSQWFRMQLSFYSGFSLSDGRYYSYLGVKVDLTNFRSLFSGNYKLVSTPEHKQLISNGVFNMYAVGTGIPSSIYLRPVYTGIGSGHTLADEYEPFEI